MNIDLSPTANSFVQFSKFIKILRNGQADRALRARQESGDTTAFKSLDEIVEVEIKVGAQLVAENHRKLAVADAKICEHLNIMQKAGSDEAAAAMENWRAAIAAKYTIEAEQLSLSEAHAAKFAAARAAFKDKVAIAVVQASAAAAATRERQAPEQGLLDAQKKSKEAAAAREAVTTAVKPTTERAGGEALDPEEAAAAPKPGAALMALLQNA